VADTGEASKMAARIIILDILKFGLVCFSIKEMSSTLDLGLHGAKLPYKAHRIREGLRLFTQAFSHFSSNNVSMGHSYSATPHGQQVT